MVENMVIKWMNSNFHNRASMFLSKENANIK